MSLKSVEMQIAIPRTKEAAVVQNQLSYKPLLDQAALAAGAAQQTAKSRRQAGKVDESVSKRIKDEAGDKRERQASSRKPAAKPAPKTAEEEAGHPYKGRHIDFSL